MLTGCTTYELPTKNNPYDSEAQTTEVGPEENPDCIQDCTGLWGEPLIWMTAAHALVAAQTSNLSLWGR